MIYSTRNKKLDRLIEIVHIYCYLTGSTCYFHTEFLFRNIYDIEEDVEDTVDWEYLLPHDNLDYNVGS